MGELKSSSITVPTIKGQLKAEYQKPGARLTKYIIEIPANMVAEFSLDFLPQSVVLLNGEDVNLSFGSIRLLPGRNVLEIKINSF